MITTYNNFDLKRISYIHVGGIVHEFTECDELAQTIKYLKHKKRFLSLGNTSKILFCFEKSNLTYFRFTNQKIVFHKNSFFVYSGISLNYLNHVLMNKGFTGFEYLSTIPGLLGGSIVNNASFLNQEISSLLIHLLVYEEGELKILKKEDIDFQYRSSGLKRENFLIIGGEFILKKEQKKIIKKNYQEAIEYRKKHQGEFSHTLGSTFKNLPGISIGKLLDYLSYKGFHLTSNCKVSNLHANFIVVEVNCNYQEIYNLIKFLQKVLYNNLGKQIELEIQIFLADGRETN